MKLAFVWMGAPLVGLAAWLTVGALEARWERWTPGDFSLELCVVQRFGPLPDGATSAERSRREELCIDDLRRQRRASREGPATFGLAALVVAYVAGAAVLTWRQSRGRGMVVSQKEE